MKGAVWELQGTNCQAGAPWSTFPHLWRSDLRYTTIMSLEQHVSASGRLYLPNKTHGLQFKPDNLHKYRKITTRDKRRKTAVEEFNSSRSWEGSATKAGHCTEYAVLKRWAMAEGDEYIFLRIPQWKKRICVHPESVCTCGSPLAGRTKIYLQWKEKMDKYYF